MSHIIKVSGQLVMDLPCSKWKSLVIVVGCSLFLEVYSVMESRKELPGYPLPSYESPVGKPVTHLLEGMSASKLRHRGSQQWLPGGDTQAATMSIHHFMKTSNDTGSSFITGAPITKRIFVRKYMSRPSPDQATTTTIHDVRLTLSPGTFGNMDSENSTIHLIEIIKAVPTSETPSPTDTFIKMGVAIHTCWLPIIIPVGLIGNIISLFVLLRSHNRRISCCVYLAALAVFDCGVLCIGAYYWAVYVIDDIIMTEVLCKVLVYLFQLFSQTGMMMILIMSVDRFLAICIPLRAVIYCTAKRAKLTTVVVCLLQIVYCVPHFFITKLVDEQTCVTFASNDIFTRVYALFNVLINSALSFVVIFCANVAVIISLRNRSKSFVSKQSCRKFAGKPDNNQDTKDYSDISNSSYQTGVDSGRFSSHDNQLACILLLVSFTYLFLTLPQYVRYTVYTFVDYSKTTETYNVYFLLYHLTNKLYYTNSAVNFILYCMSGKRFRRDVKGLFERWRCSEPMVKI